MTRSARWLLAAALVAQPLGGSAETAAAPPLPRDPSRWVGDPVGWPDPGRRVTLVFVWTFG